MTLAESWKLVGLLKDFIVPIQEQVKLVLGTWSS